MEKSIQPQFFFKAFNPRNSELQSTVLLAKVSPKKSRKLEEYKVAKAIIQLGLPGLLVTKWPCLRGQSVRTDRKLSGAINLS